MFRIVFVFIVMSMVVGCKQQIWPIPESALSFQPYQPGQELVYRSNLGDVDTVRIIKTRTQINPKDHLKRNSDLQEHLYVDALKIEGAKEEKVKFEILAMTATKEGVFIHLDLDGNKSEFYGYNGGVYLVDSIHFNYDKEFDSRVLKIESKDELFIKRANYVSALYWEKEQGLVGYDLATGEYWRLVNDEM